MILNVLFFTIYILISKKAGNAQTQCHLEEECIFATLSSSTDDIECYGYRSCEQASSITSTNGAYIWCDGAYSCYKALIIQTTSTSDVATLNCRGLFSCAFVQSISIANGNVNCRSEQSCINSMLTLSPDRYILCTGYRSCANTIATSGTFILHGSLSSINATFYSNAATTTYQFWGFESGYNSTVICNDSHTCIIECYGNGCADVTLQCATSGMCTFMVDCQFAQFDEINCPVGYQLPSDINPMPSLRNMTVSTWENSYALCKNSTKHCHDYEECNSEPVVTTDDNPSPICCTGSRSCNYATNISAFIGNGSHTAIRCDAEDACRRILTANIIEARPPGAGNIYLAGATASSSTVHKAMIETTSQYDIFCSGSRICWRYRFRNGKNLYCLAFASCRQSDSISNFDNVYGYGFESLLQSKIECIRNIYCGAASSCQKSVMTNIFGNVFGSNYHSLYQSNMSHVGGSVIGLGYRSMYSSMIHNATNVYCFSNESCQYSYIRAIHNKIEANGYNALSGSIIISESNFENNGTLYVYINDTNDADTFDLYCNETDICYIDCQAQDACTQLAVHCGSDPSRCFVSCNDIAGINCPYSGIYNQWSTESPTAVPTSIPTTIPSTIPTQLPNALKTTIPTEVPNQLTTTYSLTSNETTINTMFPTFIPR